MIKVYEKFITHCASNRLPAITYVDQAVAIIEPYQGNISVQEVLDLVNLTVGKKQFLRNFKKVVGLPPKHWCRVWQLGYIIELMESGQDLTKIALDAGFYDQAHLNHSFREFIRFSPKQFIDSKETDFMKFGLKYP